MRGAARSILATIAVSVVASPFTEPLNWWIGKYLDEHPDAGVSAALGAWNVIQEYIPSGLFPGIALGAGFAFILLRGWKEQRSTVRAATVPAPSGPSASLLEKFAGECDQLAKDLSKLMADNQPMSSERSMHSDPNENWRLTTEDYKRTIQRTTNQIRRDYFAEFARLCHMAVDFSLDERTHQQMNTDLLERPGEGVKWVLDLSRYSAAARAQAYAAR